MTDAFFAICLQNFLRCLISDLLMTGTLGSSEGSLMSGCDGMKGASWMNNCFS